MRSFSFTLLFFAKTWIPFKKEKTQLLLLLLLGVRQFPEDFLSATRYAYSSCQLTRGGIMTGQKIIIGSFMPLRSYGVCLVLEFLRHFSAIYFDQARFTAIKCHNHRQPFGKSLFRLVVPPGSPVTSKWWDDVHLEGEMYQFQRFMTCGDVNGQGQLCQRMSSRTEIPFSHYIMIWYDYMAGNSPLF